MNRRKYKKQDNEKFNRSPILWILTPIIVAWFLWEVVIMRILIIIAVLLIWTHELNKKFKRYKNRIWITILSYLITLWIIAWWLYYWYTKIWVVNDKFNEIWDWFSKIINLWQSKKWKLELQPNELWIMQEVLINSLQTTWQVQEYQNDG